MFAVALVAVLLGSGVDAFASLKRGYVIMNGGPRKYPISRNYYEEALKRLTSRTGGSGTGTGGTSLIIIHQMESSRNEHEDTEEEADATTEIRQRMRNKERNNEALKKLLLRYEEQPIRTTGTTTASSDNFEVIKADSIGIRFKDIGGFMGIKSQLMQCLDMLKNWATYAQYSVRTPKGVILEGPPGNGKTMLARAFAAECGVSFIAVSGSEFQDKYIGVGSAKVRELFSLAMENRPCIIFVDEIDALGGRRRTAGDESAGASAERDNTLNQLLVEMDGFRNNTGVFLIGATNRADLLDAALMRPGRIDKRIYVGMPDIVGRRAIVGIHIKGKPNNLTDDNMDEMVRMTGGFSGAQMENLLNEAMLHALGDGREIFEWSDIMVAYSREIGGGGNGGGDGDGFKLDDEVLQRICVHEMGHCLVGLACKNHPQLQKVMINRESMRNPGMTIFEEGGLVKTRDELFERIMILYGGQIAEILMYGEGGMSNGAVSDNEEARRVAKNMVLEYGMVGGRRNGEGLSETSKGVYDDEVGELLDRAYNMAYAILQKERDSIISGAAILKRDLVINRRDLLAYLML
jgi:cell division protease FtsH